jgi:ABC-2 type transport system ATP-binding protein
LLGDPAVLLFDEPVNGLDPEGVHWFRTLVRGMAAEGRTVLVSSHLLAEMALTVTELVVIGRGRLVAQGSLTDLAGPHGASLEETYLRLTGQSVEYVAGEYVAGQYVSGEAA